MLLGETYRIYSNIEISFFYAMRTRKKMLECVKNYTAIFLKSV